MKKRWQTNQAILRESAIFRIGLIGTSNNLASSNSKAADYVDRRYSSLRTIWCPEVNHIHPAVYLFARGSLEAGVVRPVFLNDLVQERDERSIGPERLGRRFFTVETADNCFGG